MIIKFKDETHKRFYTALVERMNAAGTDVYRQSLAYLLTVDTECRKHIDRIYNFDEHCIIPECLSESWQTSTSLNTTRIAFNLFTSSTLWCDEADLFRLAPNEIFACSYAPYYFEAIRIRQLF